VVPADAARSGPLGAVAAASALPYAERIAHLVFSEFKPDAQRRIDTMLASADEALGGEGADTLAGLSGKSERTRLLTVTAMDAAARTAWPPKVSALGRALAAGLIANDDAKIDIEQLALTAMAEIEAPHVSLLDLLVNFEPRRRRWREWEAEPYKEPQWPRVPGTDDEWRAGRRTWTIAQIGSARPPLRPVIASIIGTLQRHGLAAQNDNVANAIENFSKQLAEDVSRRSRRGGAGQPTVPAAPIRITSSDASRLTPSANWSATELGARVLGFY